MLAGIYNIYIDSFRDMEKRGTVILLCWPQLTLFLISKLSWWEASYPWQSLSTLCLLCLYILAMIYFYIKNVLCWRINCYLTFWKATIQRDGRINTKVQFSITGSQKENIFLLSWRQKLKASKSKNIHWEFKKITISLAPKPCSRILVLTHCTKGVASKQIL